MLIFTLGRPESTTGNSKNCRHGLQTAQQSEIHSQDKSTLTGQKHTHWTKNTLAGKTSSKRFKALGMQIQECTTVGLLLTISKQDSNRMPILMELYKACV